MASLTGFRDRLKKAPQVGAFFIVLGLGWQAHACPPPGPVQSAEVRQVIDGDTLQLVDGSRVRLIGLNAPEMGRDGRPSEPFAQAAKGRLESLVRESGQLISLSLGDQVRDRYGRLLAHAYDRRGESLEARLLREGLAYHIAIPPNIASADCFQAAEASAREGGFGLWESSAVRSAESIEEGGFALVRLQVREVVRNGGGLWLETDHDFVVNVPRKAMGAADWSGLSALEGRWVEVRGWITERRRSRHGARWVLPLLHPSMIAVAAPR